MPDDLGINVAETVGMKESIGPTPLPKEKKSVLFNAVAIVRAHENGKVEIVAIHFLNKDKSMEEVLPGQTRTTAVNISVPE